MAEVTVYETDIFVIITEQVAGADLPYRFPVWKSDKPVLSCPSALHSLPEFHSDASLYARFSDNK